MEWHKKGASADNGLHGKKKAHKDYLSLPYCRNCQATQMARVRPRSHFAWKLDYTCNSLRTQILAIA
eukprot:4589734-Pyramimonas_sp.AAC.1